MPSEAQQKASVVEPHLPMRRIMTYSSSVRRADFPFPMRLTDLLQPDAIVASLRANSKNSCCRN